jgi:predicted TPR repeat methyltransferase
LTPPSRPADPDALAAHHRAATHAFVVHDLETAARHCDAALTLAPDHVDALQLRGLVHLRRRELAPAESCARRAIALDPRRPGAHCTLAQACRLQNRLDEAMRHFQSALKLDAGHVESLQGLGAVHALLGRPGEAKECFLRVVAMRPGMAAARYNLGRAHEDAGETAAAAECYRQALSIDPAQPHAWLNLGGVAARLGDASAAIDAFRRAIALRPGYAAAHNNLGTILHGQGEFDRAAASFREAIRLDPGYAEAYQNLGGTLRQLGQAGEAEAALEEALRLNPAYDSARFNLGVLRGENPPRPPTGAIRTLFDDYAARFDAHLVDHLEYRIPERLAAEILALRGERARFDILDLGCGTGLFGAAMRPLANRLTGVDLSPQMLDKARARGGYDRLVAADIESFLRNEPAEGYDLVAATDVFVYLGALDDVFVEAARTLRMRGLFAFSAEALAAPAPEGYRVGPSGRYAHDAGYLQGLAHRNALTLRIWAAESIRKQRNASVPGWIAIFEKRPP